MGKNWKFLALKISFSAKLLGSLWQQAHQMKKNAEVIGLKDPVFKFINVSYASNQKSIKYTVPPISSLPQHWSQMQKEEVSMN